MLLLFAPTGPVICGTSAGSARQSSLHWQCSYKALRQLQACGICVYTIVCPLRWMQWLASTEMANAVSDCQMLVERGNLPATSPVGAWSAPQACQVNCRDRSAQAPNCSRHSAYQYSKSIVARVLDQAIPQGGDAVCHLVSYHCRPVLLRAAQRPKDCTLGRREPVCNTVQRYPPARAADTVKPEPDRHWSPAAALLLAPP